jgi:hypothetical protein
MKQTTRRDYIYYIAAFTVLLTAFTPTTTRFPGFTLEDQYERRWRHNDFKTALVVYVISDRSGYSYSTNWTQPLVTEFGSRVRFVPIADVRGVPGFLKSYIRKRFKEEFKYPVLLDWEGVVTTRIDIRSGYPNLAIVDDKGMIQHLTAGKGTATQIESFRTQLNRLLNEKGR